MIPDLPPILMHAALAELEQAFFNHDQWCEGLSTTLICHLAPDQRDLEPDAYQKCRFGQWYYGAGSAKLRNHRGFEEIAIEHQRMHQYATHLLKASMNHLPIALPDYERFVNALKRMRLEIAALKHDLEDSLFNLDPLTGAANRIGMLSKLREELDLVRRNVHSCCIAMMDVDRFKAVNDACGHATGDQVLITFTQCILARLRPYDRLYRYGGEEFLICLVDADQLAGQEIIERLRGDLALISHECKGSPFFVTVSVGLTLLDPDITAEQSIERADKALYMAKSAGRNRVVLWNPSMI